MADAMADQEKVEADEAVLQPEIIQAIREGHEASVSVWINTITPGSINNIKDARDRTYTSGDSEVSSKGMTALHYAAFYSMPGLVEMLLKAGADPTVTNEEKENALHIAMQGEGEDADIVKVTEWLLKDRHDYVDDITEESQWTALLMAVYINLPLTVDKLLEHGADPGIDVKAGEDKYRYSLALAALHEGDMLKKLLDTGKCDVKWKDGKYTALHIAVKFVKPDNVQLLVSRGADVFERDYFGMCPIHYSVNSTSNREFRLIVTSLKRSINEQDGVYQYTALHLAIIQNKPEFVRILRHKFASYSRKDVYGRLPIHYLSNQTGVQDLVDMLGDSETVINCKDKKGLTPLHYAVKKNDLELASVLIDNGADYTITATKQKHRLIHLATVANTTDNDFQAMADMFKQKIGDFNISEPDANGRTPLHWALDMRKFSRARILVKTYHADPSLTDCNLKNCLHIAFFRGCPGDVVRLILKGHRDLQKAEDKDGNTPLQYLSAKTPLAAIKALDPLGEEDTTTGDTSRQVDVVLQCGKQKKTVSLNPLMKAEDLVERAKLEFDRADIVVEMHDKEKDVWEEVTGQVYLDTGVTLNLRVIAKKEAPLNQAIELKRLDMVKLLLVKGTTLDVETLKQAIVKEDRELTLILVRHAKDVKTPLNTEIPTPSYTGDTYQEDTLITSEGHSVPIKKRTTLFRELICRMPEVAKEALERCVEVDDEVVTFDYSYIHMSKDEIRVVKNKCAEAVTILPHCNEVDHNALANPLELMVMNERIELLQHPVVWRYLFMKWNSLGFWFYFFKLFMYGVFLICLSLFVLVVNDPLSSACKSTNETLDNDTSDDLFSMTLETGCGSTSRRNFSYLMAVMVIILALYHMLVELLRMTYSITAYLKDVRNCIEILLYTTCIVFVFNFANSCGCVLDWQWQLGIFVVFLAWINLVFFASKFPLTGIYVLVFKEILITFLKLTVFSILLVLAFSLILYMMFSDPNAMISSFSNIGHSFVKTVTMVTGELGFEDLFNLGDSPSEYIPIPYYVSSFIMWIIFLVLVPIILNNMLVSLAVGDAKEVIENAELKKLILQVKTVLLAEEVVSGCIRRCCLGHIRPEMKFSIKNEKGYFYFVKLFIFGGYDHMNVLEESTYHERRKDEHALIKGKSGSDDDSTQQNQEEILRRLDQLYDIVLTNEEYIKKCQKNDQQLMKVVGRLN